MPSTSPPRTGELPVIQPRRRSAALLDQLARRMRVAGEDVIAAHGLRLRHFVALTVLRQRGESTQQALSELLQIDRTNLVGLLNELEAERLIERRRSEQDRRRHIVRLTATGGRRLARIELGLQAVEDQVLANLDAGQRDQLAELLALATGGAALDIVEAAGDDAAGGC